MGCTVQINRTKSIINNKYRSIISNTANIKLNRVLNGIHYLLSPVRDQVSIPRVILTRLPITCGRAKSVKPHRDNPAPLNSRLLWPPIFGLISLGYPLSWALGRMRALLSSNVGTFVCYLLLYYT